MAVVSVSPGINAMMPASVATYTEHGPNATDNPAASTDAAKAPSGSNTRRAERTRAVASASMPTMSPITAASTTSRAPPPRTRATEADDSADAATVSAAP